MRPTARARWVVLEDDLLGEDPLVIQDAGDHSRVPTITNDAEAMVLDLVAKGHLPPGRRLFYIDSDGQRDEILVRDGQFAGFGPEPRRRRRPTPEELDAGDTHLDQEYGSEMEC